LPKAGRPSRFVRRSFNEGGMPTRERFLLRKAYGRTGRPDKCLVVKSLDSSLLPVCPSQHGIHRHHNQRVEGTEEGPLFGRQCCFPLSRRGKYQTLPSLALSRREGRQRADAAYRPSSATATGDVNRESGTASANGGCLRRLLRPLSRSVRAYRQGDIHGENIGQQPRAY
jgi:hypothetical protein